MPKVSVFLTSFNHAKFVNEAIDSVLAQTYTDFELIVWDDCSTDNSWDIITSYSNPKIKAFRNEKNMREHYGFKKAIADNIMSGDYVSMHHSDDVWETNKLELQVAFLDTHPEYGAVFSSTLLINENNLPLNSNNIFNQPNRSRHQWLQYFFYHSNALCHPSLLIRKQCYLDCGFYKDALAQLSDLDMWIRLCLKKYEIFVLPEKLIRFRIRENTANKSGLSQDKINRYFAESYNVLNNFLNINAFEELVKIFPNAEKFYRPEGCVPHFVLALMALQDFTSPWTKLFGMNLLFDLIADDASAKQIKELYNFDYFDLITITGNHSIFYPKHIILNSMLITN